MKILLITDPHVDFGILNKKTMCVLATKLDFDIVVCTGDVSNDEQNLTDFLHWFDFVDKPKYIVPGNHDLWAMKTHQRFYDVVTAAGWKTVAPDKWFEVIDGMLFFNLYYQYYQSTNGIYYTNDAEMFNVGKHILETHVLNELLDAPVTEPVKIAFSHVMPHMYIPSKFKPHFLYVNPHVGFVSRKYGATTHLFGHTHEQADQVIDGVRYINRPIGYHDFPETMFTPAVLEASLIVTV